MRKQMNRVSCPRTCQMYIWLAHEFRVFWTLLLKIEFQDLSMRSWQFQDLWKENCFTTHKSFNTKCVFFLLTLNICDINCLESEQTPHIKGSIPRNWTYFRCQLQGSKFPDYPHFVQLGYKSEDPITPYLGLIICYNGPRNSGKH